MAIGMAKIFGFEFRENFNHPYSAKGIKTFGEDGIFPYQPGLKNMYIYL